MPQLESNEKELKLPKSYKKLLPLIQLIERPWEFQEWRTDPETDEHFQAWYRFDYLTTRTLNK